MAPQVFDALIGGILECDPVAQVGGLPVNELSEKDVDNIIFDQLGRRGCAQIGNINAAVAQAFVDHGRTDRHHGFHGLAGRLRQVAFECKAVFKHGVGIFVGLHRDDDFLNRSAHRVVVLWRAADRGEQ